MNFQKSIDFALNLDKKDPIKDFRGRFHIPSIGGKPSIYFCGNSLGLQPKSVQAMLDEELANWKEKGVKGHFEGDNPWYTYHESVKPQLSNLLGAEAHEVVPMNSLTANLHSMLVSFYNPSPERYKIIMEDGAFPSDDYAVESQIAFHGLDPKTALIRLRPRDGEYTLRTEDILTEIDNNREELALILIGAVQYYTGQFFDLEKITQAGHKAGSVVGFDLAHAIGNVPLYLHQWEVDFAVWCSYKYLNSGPGGVAGLYVHDKHAEKPDIPRFAGWWGHDQSSRFKMEKGFKPMRGADGWQLSNASVLPLVVHKASLDIFEEAGIQNLRSKSVLLTGFLEFLLNQLAGSKSRFEIITPINPLDRGCQLSIFFFENGKAHTDDLSAAGVIADWREPNVLRVAPVPLYNTFGEVFQFAELLERSLN